MDLQIPPFVELCGEKMEERALILPSAHRNRNGVAAIDPPVLPDRLLRAGYEIEGKMLFTEMQP
jgi:hypothetical protein